MAGALVEMSLHTSRAGLLLAGAVAFGLLAVTARGPLGVVRVCGGRVHAVLDVIVAVALALAPIVPALRPGPLGIVAVEVVAVTWLRVVTLTRFSPNVGRAAPSATASGTRSSPPSGDRRTEIGVPGASAVARALGLFAGRTVRRLPDPPDDLAERARQAGHRLARLQRAWQARSRP